MIRSVLGHCQQLLYTLFAHLSLYTMSAPVLIQEHQRDSDPFGAKWVPKAGHAALRPISNVPLFSSVEPRTVERIAPHAERRLGETEVSYFLPSRESGVNDMYLHLGCRAAPHLMERRRVALVWAIMRTRHPLLASQVRMNSYEDISFVYDAPLSPKEALADVDAHLEYRSQTKDDLISSYLNGPRTLSNDRLSHFIISQSEPSSDAAEQNYDFMICATHFLGDGMALHQFANDFFGLLGSATLDQSALTEKLAAEWAERTKEKSVSLPSAMESRLPDAPSGRLARVASRVDFDLSQQSLIGGHSFPRRSSAVRHTVVPTISLDRDTTKAVLKNCKNHGVSFSAALFAISNIAWARTHSSGRELPMMMYSALNMRPSLTADKRLNDSYWFLAIGYFNIVLPTFFPQSGDADVARTFWHRARIAKAQSTKAAKTPMSVSRCREMAVERGARARVWAKEDDDKLAGVVPPKSAPAPAKAPAPGAGARFKPKVPSTALLGLSLLGNLDGIYKHAAFPDIKLHTLTTGSRQRAGGMLLFGYTFAEKLWLSFGYDENGFEEDTVKHFWKNILDAVDEFLVPV